MASILEMNLDWARANNLPIAATYEKLLATPGGATLYDNEYNINNWEDLAEGLAEQLVSQLETKGTKDFLIDNARQISAVGAQTNSQDFNNFIQTLNTLPLTQTEANQANTNVQQGVADLNFTIANATELRQPGGGWGSLLGDVGRVTQQLAANPVVQIGIAYYMPGVVESFAPSLSAIGITNAATQTAVANAIASTAVQVASGVPINDALQNAVTNAVVSSGSPAIAREINRVIDSPGVTNAIVSAGSSAAKTALNGGSESDITRNLVAGLVGSGVATATDSNVAGATAGGAVSGGVTGALQGAASSYGSQAAAEERARKQTSGTSADPGIKVAGGDDATALKMASISAMPEMLGKSGETASPLSAVVEGGQTFYERTITGKSPDGKEYSYTVTYDPGASAGRQVSYSTSGVVKDAEGNVIPSGGGGATASFTRPNFTATEVGTYTPTIITTGQPFTSSTRPTTNITPSDTSILNLISTGGGARDTTVGTGTQEGTSAGTSTRTDRGTDLGTGVIETGTGTRGKGTGTGGGAGTNVGTGAGVGTGTGAGGQGDGTGSGGEGDGAGSGGEGSGIGGGGEGDGTGGGTELPPVEDKTGTPVTTYTPTIFTYGGVNSTLGTSLGTTTKIPTSSTTTGTSVGLGGRGEIESKESGKKRQNVWNEESLRLKDALGL